MGLADDVGHHVGRTYAGHDERGLGQGGDGARDLLVAALLHADAQAGRDEALPRGPRAGRDADGAVAQKATDPLAHRGFG